jgi:hypothetical protein
MKRTRHEQEYLIGFYRQCIHCLIFSDANKAIRVRMTEENMCFNSTSFEIYTVETWISVRRAWHQETLISRQRDFLQEPLWKGEEPPEEIQ